MTPEMQDQLIDLKDELLTALARVDELFCGEVSVDGIVDPDGVVRKRQTPIQYDLQPRGSSGVAFKERNQ